MCFNISFLQFFWHFFVCLDFCLCGISNFFFRLEEIILNPLPKWNRPSFVLYRTIHHLQSILLSGTDSRGCALHVRTKRWVQSLGTLQSSHYSLKTTKRIVLFTTLYVLLCSSLTHTHTHILFPHEFTVTK
jgi:hypothetical protein